ncbi:hypothetical protein [Clostridium autoethanogenum]|uniref:hypothetical protein n=1 Tax=Clostridium autoethanogenum TaxID=84023 RepID=UPI00160509B9|nr:hypothetical protein [Clostridium autoethanogenum]
MLEILDYYLFYSDRLLINFLIQHISAQQFFMGTLFVSLAMDCTLGNSNKKKKVYK